MGAEKLPTVFCQLQALRNFERRHLGFLKTFEERDLLLHIGAAQESGKPMTLRQALIATEASIPTIQRRLRRLQNIGVLERKPRAADSRSVELTIAPKALKAFSMYGTLLKRVTVSA